MQDLLNKIRRKILDESDRDQIIIHAFKHRREANPIHWHHMEERIRISIKVGGFRDPFVPGVPDQMVLNKLLPASKTKPMLEESIINVWVDLKPDLRKIARKIMDTHKDSLLAIKNGDGDEQEEKLLALVGEMAKEITDRNQCPVEDARLMLIYTIDQVLDADETDIEWEESTSDEPEVTNDIAFDETIELSRWLSQLQNLPAASALWDEMPLFIEKVNELTLQKIQERNNINSLIQALDAIKEAYYGELEYFELAGGFTGVPRDMEPAACLDLTHKAEQLISLFKQHLELRAGEGRDRTISEAEARRKSINDLEQEIKPLCEDINERLADHNQSAEQSLQKEEKAREPDYISDPLFDDSDVTTPTETEPEIDPKETPGVQPDLVIDRQEVSIIEVDIKDEIINGTASSIPDTTGCGVEDITVTRPADMDLETENQSLAEYNSIELGAEAGQEDSTGGACEEAEDKASEANNSYIELSVELLVQQIAAASIGFDDLPKAWVLIKASRELYGERPELEALPTSALMELYYLSERIHRDPLLYSTHRRKLDSIAGEIKTNDLSRAQAGMHFAASLPLVLAHAYDPLRASLFYRDYMPDSFNNIYGVLSEYATKVSVPILSLYGVEQRQNQHEEQRKRLSDQINRSFEQYSGTNKTSIDAFLFPRFGKGPIQWIRDGIQNGECSDEFVAKLEETTAENIFSLFIEKKENSIADQKLANITAVRDAALDKINNILNLASAWATICDDAKPIDDFHYRAFKQLQSLFDEHYDQWIDDLDKELGELIVPNCWMKKGLEHVFEYVRGVKSAAEFAG